MIVLSIYVIYFLIYLVAGVQLYRGTKQKVSHLMRLYLILSAVGVILAFLQIFLAGWGGLIGAIATALFYGYFFVCIYSLYDLYKAVPVQTYA